MSDYAEPNWQSSHLRLKAHFGQRSTFFVGKAGTVIREKDNAIFKMSQEEMIVLEERIENFRGVIDVNVANRYIGK
jgi:hypothetical protein